MMFLRRWISALRERIRAFLGLDVLPTRSETIALRDDLAKYHREIMQFVAQQPKFEGFAVEIPSFQAPTLDWETMQKLELLKMMQNPPKED